MNFFLSGFTHEQHLSVLLKVTPKSLKNTIIKSKYKTNLLGIIDIKFYLDSTKLETY